MPAVAGESCNNCQFFKIDAGTNAKTGTCLRYPPQISYQAAVGYQDPKQGMIWPKTYGTEWCGEWQLSK